MAPNGVESILLKQSSAISLLVIRGRRFNHVDQTLVIFALSIYTEDFESLPTSILGVEIVKIPRTFELCVRYLER